MQSNTMQVSSDRAFLKGMALARKGSVQNIDCCRQLYHYIRLIARACSLRSGQLRRESAVPSAGRTFGEF